MKGLLFWNHVLEPERLCLRPYAFLELGGAFHYYDGGLHRFSTANVLTI